MCYNIDYIFLEEKINGKKFVCLNVKKLEEMDIRLVYLPQL